MKKELLMQAMIKFVSGVVLVGLLIFLPAGTVRFKQGWLLMAVLFLPIFLAGLVMYAKAPHLLESRLKAKEKEMEQKTVIALSGLMFVGGFVMAGLDFRFGWSDFLPGWVSSAAAVVFLLSYVGFGEVLRENAYLSRTVEVQEGQTVVDTGLYGLVRHPMYLVTVFLFLSMPLVLGSLWAFPIFLIHPLLMVKRIRNEEEVLRRDLKGYEAYTRKVKYRMIPFVW